MAKQEKRFDVERAYVALDWLARTYAATWLEFAGFDQEAHVLRNLERVVDPQTALTATLALRRAGRAPTQRRTQFHGGAARVRGMSRCLASTAYAAGGAWDDVAGPARIAAWSRSRSAFSDDHNAVVHSLKVAVQQVAADAITLGALEAVMSARAGSEDVSALIEAAQVAVEVIIEPRVVELRSSWEATSCAP